MTANEMPSQTSPLYDALPITTWSLPPDIDRDGHYYDVVNVPPALSVPAETASDNEGRRSRCEKLWPCSRRNRTRMNRSISPIASLIDARSRTWHMARHGSLLAISTFYGIQCIRFLPSDGRFQQRSHRLFDPIRAGKTFDSPCFLDISEDGRCVAFLFDCQLYVYELNDPFNNDTPRRVLVMPINGTIVAVQFVYVPAPDCFICVVTVEALIFVVDVRKAKIVLESYSPRRSLADSLMFNFSSFGTEQSLQYALENVSRAVRVGHDRFVIVGPRSDPLPEEILPPKAPIRVTARMVFLTLQVHVDRTGRIEIRTLDSVSKDDTNFTPSRRFAQLLGQARSILTHASPNSVFDVVIARSPKATLVATLDVYGHVSMWLSKSARDLGCIQLPMRPMDLTFFSESQLAVAYESGSVRIWNISINDDGFTLIEHAELAPTGEKKPASVNLSSVGDDASSGEGVFVLESLVEYLQARRSWPEPQTVGLSENIIEHTSFKLRYLQTVAAEEILSRLIFRNQFDAAMQICCERGLSADPVYKRRWGLADPIDTTAIKKYLAPVIGDLYWKLEQCRLRCADGIDAQRQLLQFGLSLTDSASKDLSSDDDILWAYRLVFFYYVDLLETFILVQPYDMDKYSSFRRTSLLETAKANAHNERVSTVQVLLHRHGALLDHYIYTIFDSFPESTPISMYAFLIPTSNRSPRPQRSQSVRPADWVELNQRYLDRALACDSVRICPDLQPWMQCMSRKPQESASSPPLWFKERALHIDAVSGFLSNSLDLLRIGAEAYPEDTELAVLKSSAELLAHLLYEWDVDADPSLSLRYFHKADSMTKIGLLLQNTRLKDAADAVSQRLTSELRGQPLTRYIVKEFAGRHTAVVVDMIRAGIAEASQVASECVARCIEEPGDLESLRFLADVADDPETARWVNSAAITARRHHPCSPSFFAASDALEPTLELVDKLILDEIGVTSVGTGTASRRYAALLDDLYTIVGPKHISGAQELFLAAVLGSGQIDIGRQFSNLIDHERFQEIALMEVRHQFNLGSENVDIGSDPHMLTARAILALCDHSEDVAHERSLMHAWSFLYKIGMRRVTPIELRSGLYRDQLMERFVQHCIVHHEEAMFSGWVQEFTRIFNLDSTATSRLLMQCGIEASKASPQLRSFSESMAALAMTSHSFSDGWKGCMEIGGRLMYCHAIWSCPDSELLQCVRAAATSDERDVTDPRLESICVLNVVDQVIHKQLPKTLPLNDRDIALLMMRDSYTSSMAFLWFLPRVEATELLEQNVTSMDDADFALKFVAISILAERGMDVRDLLSASVDTLLDKLTEERSIVALQERRRKIERTGRLLHGLNAVVDLERFVLDDAYMTEMLLRLVQSLEISEINAALSLAVLYDHDPGQLFAQHLSFAFRSINDPVVLEQHVDQLSAVCLKSISGSWFEFAMSSADGSDFTRLLVLYQLKSRQPDLLPASRSRFQKHASILERLRSGRISLDYKVVLGGGTDAYHSVRAAVNDRTVAILMRLASRIRELQQAESIPALAESTILIDYLSEALLARPPTSASYGAFVGLHGQYLSRLSLEHLAEVIRKVSHSQSAVDFVSRYVSENIEAENST